MTILTLDFTFNFILALNWASRPFHILNTDVLQAGFGVNFAPYLRSVQPRTGAIKDGSSSIQKNVSSGRPRFVWIPEMTSKMSKNIGA